MSVVNSWRECTDERIRGEAAAPGVTSRNPRRGVTTNQGKNEAPLHPRRLRVVIAAAVAFAGCGAAARVRPIPAAPPRAPAPRSARSASPLPEKANDYGWNQQGVEGAKAAAAAEGAQIEVADGSGYDNIEPVLRRLAQRGSKMIIAQASGYNTVAPKVAAQFKVPTLVYDSPSSTKAGTVADVETSSQQGAYLAGILAASVTKTNTLGIVISADTNWFKQSGGSGRGRQERQPQGEVQDGPDRPGGLRRLGRWQAGHRAGHRRGRRRGVRHGRRGPRSACCRPCRPPRLPRAPARSTSST
ncbi:MAG: BMP family ABC transporter substrate-binding protein [Thermoleophilia bacterium]